MARARYGSLGSERKTKEYRAWQNMRNRCNNKNYYLFHRYGGRGIEVCERWGSYANFLADMGRAPTKSHSIDRIDNDKNYSPENCKWSTHVEQSNNRDNNHKLEYKGRVQSISAWCKELDLEYSVVNRRIQLGWSGADAIEKPLEKDKYVYKTPAGEFQYFRDAAAFHGIKAATAWARFASKTNKEWEKVEL